MRESGLHSMLVWSPFHSRESGVELEMVKEELRQCKERHEAQVLSLTQQLEMERERGEESGRSLVVEGCGQQQRSYNRKLEKLRSRLRGQVEQSNYLRVKLGKPVKKGLKLVGRNRVKNSSQ